MRVLGVDPGLTRCGVGVVDGGPGRSVRLVDVGVIRTPADLDTGHRLLSIEQRLEEWVCGHHPDAIAVERVFAQHNLSTVTGTAQAAGVAMLIGARHSIPVVLHTPSEVKAAITGSGRADKAQVGEMVRRLLKLDASPHPADAADACALAICHLWRGVANDRFAAGANGRVNRYAEAVARHRSGEFAMRGRSGPSRRPASPSQRSVKWGGGA